MTVALYLECTFKPPFGRPDDIWSHLKIYFCRTFILVFMLKTHDSISYSCSLCISSPQHRVASSHKKKKHSSENNSSKRKPWIRPSLRVRFVDKKYHHGKYFNSKVVIEDVISPYTCICQTENRKLLDGIDQDQLETVIPKDEGSNVMIVGVGKYYNKMGQIMKRDKSACQAIVKLCEDESVIKLHFDEICEYVGELPEYIITYPKSSLQFLEQFFLQQKK
ncbi:G-patch domain and KOW motifs-containing protein [Nymphon striatum]|nr:G-patch domain and KOW motifs-containing protein [Nymphon striatum]